MTTLYLVRHGRTRLNKDKVFRGMFDVPLDEVGEAEGRAAAQALRNAPISRVLASPLSRARRTAQFLSEATGAPVEVCDALRDIDYGQWTERPDDEVRREDPGRYNEWLTDPGKVRFPGGESLADVRGRVRPVLDRIAGQADAVMAIVSHRATLKVMLCEALDLADRYFRRLQLDTASWSRLDHDGDWRLTTLNATEHLAGVKGHLEAEDF